MWSALNDVRTFWSLWVEKSPISLQSYVSAEEPSYIHSAKEPYVPAKEPYVSAEEPFYI